MAVAVITAVALTTTVSAAQDSEGSTFNMTVSQIVEVDVSPNRMDYAGVQPGDTNLTSDRNYGGVEIENIGSENITNIWVGASYPSIQDSTEASTPFGTGTAGSYDAGNFIVVRPTSEVAGVVNPDDAGSSANAAGYHFVNRVEFNATNDLSYIRTPDSTSRYGRFRVGNESLFWLIDYGGSNSDGNLCDGEGSSVIRVGNEPHSREALGSVDFRDGSGEYVEYSIPSADEVTSTSSGRSYGQVAAEVDIQSDKGNRTYTLLTYCGGPATSGGSSNATFVVRSRYNVKPLDVTTQLTTSGGRMQKIMNNSIGAETDELQPGEHFTLETGISVPYGVTKGQVGTGTLTVYATNN
ncbi:MAG: hypothetical protein ABEK01_00140 [Candidatus Nanohaloarchaea archaeon]